MPTPDLSQLDSAIASIQAYEKSVMAIPPPAPTGNDFSVHVPPTSPAPGVGVWTPDPTFGSRVLRVTGGGADSFRTQSAGYPWSCDSKRFAVLEMGGAPRLFEWDGTVAIDRGTLPFSSEACFSKTNPLLVYGIRWLDSGAVVSAYDLATKRLTDLVGVRDLVPNVDLAGRTYARGLCTSAERFSFQFGGQAQDDDYYVYAAPLVDPRAGALVDTVAQFNFRLHASVMDLSQQFVALCLRDRDIKPFGAPQHIWDLNANAFTKMTASAGGHGVWGFGDYVNAPDDEDALEHRWRKLSVPNLTRKIVTPYPTPSAFKLDTHLAWNGVDRSIVSALYRYAEGLYAPWRACDDELIEINIDTGAIRRLAHHQSWVALKTSNNGWTDNDYWSEPKPVNSPDGRWTQFTTNWRRTLGTVVDSGVLGPRQDVFVLDRRF